ncbi:hypothetical protein M431DRAFT_524580 [Trichoderma harzianum CBS 226.95]|uniref:Uncharacterized protein n=1 Tax=Trichoderma harzianum CBS 226.95 TaxID=983964 RepID=A0A2T3ZX39_TRIHA|nr:hypothetical protein M431DRAFT_524580 [Trichoderma harzianum CBS 226.95]PTB49384.1 hypothetical protein M431DRAFT_524580 [Trichoderma harzianum CBS 226.95]
MYTCNVQYKVEPRCDAALASKLSKGIEYLAARQSIGATASETTRPEGDARCDCDPMRFDAMRYDALLWWQVPHTCCTRPPCELVLVLPGLYRLYLQTGLVPPLHSHFTSRTPPARASTCTLYSRCWPAHWPAAKARRNEWLVQEGARAIGRPTRERIAGADWLRSEPQQFPAVVSGFISFYRKLLTGGTSTNCLKDPWEEPAGQKVHHGALLSPLALARAPPNLLRSPVTHGATTLDTRNRTLCAVRHHGMHRTVHLCVTNRPSHGHAPLRPGLDGATRGGVSVPRPAPNFACAKSIGSRHHYTPPSKFSSLLRPTLPAAKLFPCPRH